MAYAADHPPVSPPPPPPRRLEPPAFAMPKVELVRAVHRYEQQEDGDLSIEPGDVIEVLQKEESGWWYGRCGGAEGLFPMNYAEPA
mmetsp:Transcript_30547/g.97479  ORF Transcript_30547/g.97479 Transcript_30547/m.97479 type:complete len:86 (+) Transcript_30547:3-260(+)